MKKFSAILLALVLVLAMSATAFAADAAKITITNAANGVTYKIFKLFDATTTNDGKIAYTGEIPTGLETYFQKDAAGNITATAAAKNSDKLSDAAIAALKTWASSATATASKAGNGESIEFTGIEYGYYVILAYGVGEDGAEVLKSTISVDSTKPTANVVDKNEEGPTPPEKTADGQTVSGAQIGDTVDFKITGKLARYSGETEITSYTFTDEMGTGLTYNKDLTITVAGKLLTKDTDYTITETDQGFVLILTNKTDAGFVFDVDAEYEITYTATLNENADTTETGNKNEVKLTWNNNQGEQKDTTTTKTYEIVVKKTDGTQSLSGAEFDLYDANTEGHQIPLIKVENGVYRVATTAEAAAEDFTSAKIEAGTATIKGLDNKSYWLEETKAPDGYNKLVERKEVRVGENGVHSVDAVVVNNAGSELPSTGGMGTTIFYVVGGLMMAAAVVILVAKKKVAAEK